MTALLDDFLIRAGLAAVGVAVIAGPLGCFVVWRRMAYFGEAVAHSALLGVALGLATALPILPATLLVSVAMAAAVAGLALRGVVTRDAGLGVFAHAALAVGLVAVSQIPDLRIDLTGFLFGDVLAVSRSDLAAIWVGAAAIGGLLTTFWRRLLNATLSEELAWAEGDRPIWAEIGVMLALATLIALAMQIVGLLLVTAMLVIPASAARPLARSPEAMALGAAAIGVLGAVLGLSGAFVLDAPAGPTIVVTVFLGFCLTAAFAGLRAALRAR